MSLDCYVFYIATIYITQFSVMSKKVHFSVLDLKAPSQLHCKIIYSIVGVSSCLFVRHWGFMSKE